jgi:hypothetical protein
LHAIDLATGALLTISRTQPDHQVETIPAALNDCRPLIETEIKMTSLWRTARTIAVASALGVAGLGISGPTIANAAVVIPAPAPAECFHFTMNNVPIRNAPNGSTIVGLGQLGQVFFSGDPVPRVAGGKTWLPGVDRQTNVPGWVYIHNLTSVPCG